MTSIWGFLNQTLTVSIVAAVLLIVKELLNDKLSPRWQYGIWSILLFRMLLPVNTKRMVFLPVSYWLESLKANVEVGLDSVYTKIYQPVQVNSILPALSVKPESVTDWIFVIYIIGIAVCLLRYLIVFLALKWKLRKGNPMTEEVQKQIQNICGEYGLQACKVLTVKGLQTAFVCAGVKPVLVLPERTDLEENVILHELLHLKYHDEWQTIVWCIVKCFHWCNPFLWYVFKRIENDMESLCDQRVLERIEGEARRNYGIVLLQMANEKYARVPGTSSISNGGRNIKRRIEAIVRYKKYPQGMALVSICIGVVFFFPVFVGTSLAYDTKVVEQPTNESELTNGMSIARLKRCTTLAGALDTYAKGLKYHRGVFIAIASPLEKHEALAKEMFERVNDLDQLFLYDSGEEFEYVRGTAYWVANLHECGENEFTAFLVFDALAYEEEGSYEGSLVVPVRAWKEDAWVVEECADRIIVRGDVLNLRFDEEYKDFFAEEIYYAKAKTGNVVVRMSNEATVNNWIADEMNFFGMGTYGTLLKVDAVFENIFIYETVEYTYTEDENGNLPKYSFGMVTAGLETRETKVEITNDGIASYNGGGSTNAGGKYGHSWINRMIDVENKDDRTIESGGGAYTLYNVEEVELEYPEAYLIQIYWDGKMVEELIVE